MLALLLNKAAYDQYKDLVDLNAIKETFRELSHLYLVLFALHEEHDRDFTVDELEAAFHVKYPEADKIIYGKLLDDLRKIDISPEVGASVLKDVKLRKAALRLSELAYKVGQGLCTVEEYQAAYKAEFEEVDHNADLPLSSVTTDLEEIIHATFQSRGLRWRLDCLNKSLGSLRRGDFGFLFARPETGKTTFLASEVTSFLAQGDEVIVWLNNEEQGSKVMLRVYQAYFGVTKEELLRNPKKYREQFQRETGGRFHLFDSAQIHRNDVERIVSKLAPAVVVYDQIDKIKGFVNDREDLRLGSIYQWARELAKGSHAAIGVCQADGQAEGVRYLTMEHVANAKTAKQAEADWILGIGTVHDDASPTTRYLNISKNKLTGDEDSISQLRHGRFEVLIEAEIARYRDVIKFN